MKKKYCFLLLFFAFISCKQEITTKDIAKINGYWEIETVDFPNGNNKNYKINETFDYFEIKNSKGFRKKVTPQLDGTFLTNDTSASVEIVFKNNQVFLNYSTTYNTWQEELIAIDNDNLIVKNAQNIKYTYKKSRAINIINNGQENK